MLAGPSGGVQRLMRVCVRWWQGDPAGGDNGVLRALLLRGGDPVRCSGESLDHYRSHLRADPAHHRARLL